jgi:hypothetical protein
MYKLLRMAVFALPLAGGAAWAQASGTSGSAGAPGSAMTPPVTDDTRTPLQQRAGRLDDTAPAMPGDATKPVEVPNRVEERATTPDTVTPSAPSDTGNQMNAPGSEPTDKQIHKHETTDESRMERKSDTTLDTDRNDNTTKMENKSLDNADKDQLNSDK